LDWVTVSAGNYHTCGIRENGTLRCWGANGGGQLGVGDRERRYAPALVGAAHDWVTVSAGIGHTCGLRSEHRAYCWGTNRHGQIGDGTTKMKLYPRQVASGHTWETITTGFAHTCGTRVDGTLWCWGEGHFGQLGLGADRADKAVPAQVGANRLWQSVSAGWAHTCGYRSNHSLFCWGKNSSGQIGDGTYQNRWRPTFVKVG
jgi:alpha-tubulin suppressor-like RCC1 family protein